MANNSLPKVTFSRSNTAERIEIYKGGVIVGNITASPNVRKQFIVRLNGLYYTHNGLIDLSCKGCPTKTFVALTSAFKYVRNIVKVVEILV